MVDTLLILHSPHVCRLALSDYHVSLFASTCAQTRSTNFAPRQKETCASEECRDAVLMAEVVFLLSVVNSLCLELVGSKQRLNMG